MHELEKMSASTKKRASNPDQIDVNFSSGTLQSPVLSPSTSSTDYFGGSDSHSNGGPEDGSARIPTDLNGSHNANNSAVNKAVEDWIAKARESLHEFGAFIGIGGAGMPKSYLVDEDFEGSDSGDEEFVDVSEDLDGLGNGDYGIAVEQPDGDQTMNGNSLGGGALHHKSSSSSLGTVATTNTTGVLRKKSGGERSKPANLPVEASPFGLFGNLSIKNSRSRAGSQEPEEEDKGPGIANEDFFKSSECGIIKDRSAMLNLFSARSDCSRP